ncbi:MAG: sugar ABC transporter permease [Limnochordales bacterium]|nr:sugar ABC transporter permease [Limnochordales bacterium]
MTQASKLHTPRRRINRQWLFAYALLAPTLLLIFIFNVWPLVYSAYLSLQQYSLLFPIRRFVGLENYRFLFEDPEFIAALGRTLYFVVVSLALETTIGLAVALVLNERFFGRGLVRTIVLLPWAIPTIVNGVLWRWIYQPNFGALNGLLWQLGIIDEYVHWLGEPWRAMNMVILADAWHMIPFYTLMFLAGLQGIPDSLHEAARVDGAGWFRRFWHITLPLLRPILLVILVIRTIETFRVFDIIYALTRGGPGGGTTVVGYYAYEQAFSFADFGMGSAASMVITLSVLVLAVLYVKLLYRDELLH